MIELEVQTSAAIAAVDLTDRIADRAWPDGFLWVSCPHTTVALVIGEADADMLADYERIAAELFAQFQPFRHHRNDKPNAAAHLLSSFAGTQLLLAVIDGRVDLGAYQRIVLIELDGPKPRRVRLASVPMLGIAGEPA